jgi:hypothetical protein
MWQILADFGSGEQAALDEKKKKDSSKTVFYDREQSKWKKRKDGSWQIELPDGNFLVGSPTEDSKHSGNFSIRDKDDKVVKDMGRDTWNRAKWLTFGEQKVDDRVIIESPEKMEAMGWKSIPKEGRGAYDGYFVKEIRPGIVVVAGTSTRPSYFEATLEDFLEDSPDKWAADGSDLYEREKKFKKIKMPKEFPDKYLNPNVLDEIETWQKKTLDKEADRIKKEKAEKSDAKSDFSNFQEDGADGWYQGSGDADVNSPEEGDQWQFFDIANATQEELDNDQVGTYNADFEDGKWVLTYFSPDDPYGGEDLGKFDSFDELIEGASKGSQGGEKEYGNPAQQRAVEQSQSKDDSDDEDSESDSSEPTPGAKIKGTDKDGNEYEGELVKMIFGKPKIKTDDGTEVMLTDFEKTSSRVVEAAWSDIIRKAKRLRAAGAITILNHEPQVTAAIVKGDSSTYDVVLHRQDPGKKSITMYECSCPWGQWAFKRQVTFVGRMCSHALAVVYEVQSMDYWSQVEMREMFGDEGATASKHVAKRDIFFLPSRRRDRKSQRQASVTAFDREALIDEDGEASNLNKLDLTGTHYLDSDSDLYW